MEDIDSDYYTKEILTQILREQDLRKQDLSDENYADVLKRVVNMNSDSYKEEFLNRALGDSPSQAQLLGIVKTVNSIDSDYYKSEVLKSACDMVSQSTDAIKNEFRVVAKSIKSDTYYGRVSRCMD